MDYLNQHWIRRQRESKIENVYDVFSLFYKLWFIDIYSGLDDRLQVALGKHLRELRLSQNPNIKVVTDLSNSICNLSSYLDDLCESAPGEQDSWRQFSTLFEDSARSFYRERALKIRENYIVEANSIFEYEGNIVSQMSHFDKSAYHEILVETLVRQHADILKQGFAQVLASKDYKACDLCFRLFSKTADELKYYCAIYEAHIATMGKASILELNASSTFSSDFVQTTYQQYLIYLNLAERLFKHPSMIDSVERGCKLFFNDFQDAAKHLCQFVDTVLRFTDPKDDEVEDVFEEILVV